jgi:RHS repeat-associated protein
MLQLPIAPTSQTSATEDLCVDDRSMSRRQRVRCVAPALTGIAVALLTPGPAAAQICAYPYWYNDIYPVKATSTLGAVPVATAVIYPFMDPTTHPGVSPEPPPICTVVSGNELAGTAIYGCTESCLCGPPTCISLRQESVQVNVWEACQTPFWATAAPCDICSPDSVAHPINPGVGNMFTTETDITLNGNTPIVFKRYYNSANTASADLGPAWRHSFTRSVNPIVQPAPYAIFPGSSQLVAGLYADVPTACSQGFAAISPYVTGWVGGSVSMVGSACVVSNAAGSPVGTMQIYANSTLFTPLSSPIEYDLTRDDGQLLRYTLQSGVINPQPGNPLRLAITGSGFTLTDTDDTVETYNAQGQLQSITTRGGNTLTITYDGSGRLSTVSDSFGHSITLGYDTQSRVSTVSDPSGHAVQYAYDTSGRLSTVTNLDGTTQTYLYQYAPYPDAMTGLLDETGTQFATWGYDVYGRATSSQEAGGANATSLTYNSTMSVTVTDPLTATRTFTYARVGDINRPTSISGSQCPTCSDGASTTYDLAGYVSSRTDYNGNVTCYSNDPVRGLEVVRVEGFSAGSTCPTNLSTYTPTAGTAQRKITTSWHATFHEPLLITEANRATGFTYDSSGNMLTKTITDTSVTPNVARTWTYTYDGYGRVLTAKLPRTDVNSTTKYVYYPCTTGSQCGQLQTATNALSQVTTFNTYDPDGEPLTVTDPNGVVTTLTYDARHRLTSRKVGTETTGFSYYPTGLLQTVTLPDSSSVTYTYDGAHRLTQISDGLGNTIKYTLDAAGNRTSENDYDPTSVLARTHTWVYNTLSELYQDIGAAGTSAVATTFGYDSNGNRMTINAPLSRTTTNAFDALNRLTQVSDPNSGITKYAYDANDNLTKVTDPRNLITGYQYTGFGDVKQLTSPDTGVTNNTYDSGGNLAMATDARSAISTYTYDALNRVKSVAYKIGSTTDQTITYTYDAGTNGKGRLTGASDANHSMTWTYDSLGRVASKKQTQGSVNQTVGYVYTNGDLTTLTTPSGQTVVYSYSNNQVTGITINGTTLLSGVAYEPFGPARGWTWGNGTAEVRLHNTDGNPSQVSAVEASSYSYDNAFRITGITNSSNSALSWTYGYDLLDRLTSASKTGTTQGWTYDANGNRLTQTGNVTGTYTLSTTSNRLNSITGTPARTYTYSNSGSTLTYASNTFTYYNSGRMKTVKVGSSTTTYVYNALGQRIKKSGGSAGTVLTVFDETGHLLGEYSSTGALVQETVWLGDTPVATIRPGSPAIVYYVHADHLNAPRMVTQSIVSGKIAWRWDADPFGTPAPNQNPGGLGTFVYNLRYPGQYFDSETGLNYNYFRDYDPATGRYIESDPMDAGQHVRRRLAALSNGADAPPLDLNSYSYVSDDPLLWIDPFGLDTLMCVKFWHPHTFLCVDGTCSGKYPSGNPISSAGVIRDDSQNQSKASCSAVPNKCPGNSFDDCVKKRLLQRGPSGDQYNWSGANCGQWAEDVVSSCRALCTSSK